MRPTASSVASLAALCLLLMAPGTASAQAEAVENPPAPLRSLDFAPFEDALARLSPGRRSELDELVVEASVSELGAAMSLGGLTSEELVTYYLARTRDLDVGGLQSMNELNPEALEVAATLDAERAAGSVRGPLHGIVLSIKDNIGTGDQMHNTAGAAAMEGARSDRDAALVTRLREAGAVILGKANMTEWAAFMQIPGQPAGFSALGGQVANPYSAELSPSGSSAGSAVGTSASLVTASVGTETLGSIIAPASANGVVGLKPSLGLVSRDRIIPITDQTDTAGVLARSVSDAAAVFSAIVGSDPEDPVTAAADGFDVEAVRNALDPDALQGVRVGFDAGGAAPPAGMTDDEFLATIGFADAVAGLEAAGAEVDLIWAEPFDNFSDFTTLGTVGLDQGVRAYLEATAPDVDVRSVADVADFNRTDPARFAPYGQSVLEAAAGLPEVSRDEYEAGGAGLRQAARDYLEAMVDDHDVDVLVSRDNRLSSAYATAGYPAVSVPAGLSPIGGGPVGLTFVGGYLDDARLLGYAYAFEQAAPLRQPPLD